MARFGKMAKIAAIVLIAAIMAAVPGLLAANNCVASNAVGGTNNGSVVAPEDEFRATWVSTVVNLDYPSSRTLTTAQLKAEADSLLDKAKAAGLTAVILQVRPCGDAFYKSSIFPWSYYLTGSQGTAPADSFDPLQYWVEGAHARGLELHAWINPFRITMGSASSPQTDTKALASTNPARLHPEWTVAYTDGRLYYNPGIAAVRQLVIDGVKEIVQNYDVDGVHFDDYFYPGTDFNDAAAFKADPRGFTNISDWRRDNVDKLISETYKAVKAIDPDCAFGVSPAGIWANKSSNTLGSDTKGYQTYYSCYADTRKWVKNNWLDYIAPQIYWNQGYAAADYTTLVNWWSDVVNGTNVKLYVGLAAYRIDPSSSSTAWKTCGELVSQLWLNRRTPNVSGSIFFRAQSILSNPVVYDMIKSFYTYSGDTSKTGTTTGTTTSISSGTGGAIVDPTAQGGTASSVTQSSQTSTAYTSSDSYIAEMFSLPSGVGVGTLAVNSPGANTTMNTSSYYLQGTSDPTKPLTMNGKAITNRSPAGFFGITVTLEKGANTFEFRNGDTVVTRVITRGTVYGTSTYPTSDTPSIVRDSVYPTIGDKVYRAEKGTISFSCNAPIGSTVYVTFQGKSFIMTPDTTTLPYKDGKYYLTTFRYTYQMGAFDSIAAGSVVELGAPVYSMTLNGATDKVSAGMPYLVKSGASFGVTVKTGAAKMYSSASSSQTPSAELPAGMKTTGRFTGGGWVELPGSYYVFVDSLDLYTLSGTYKTTPSSSSYTVGAKTEDFSINESSPSLAAAFYDSKAKTLVLRVWNTTAATTPKLPSNSIFSSVNVSYNDKTQAAAYLFKLKNTSSVDGYYIDVTSNGITLHVKQRPKKTDGTLNGITVLLDPGHGGSATGALGALGTKYCEKNSTLDICTKLKTKLESMGATVNMTRSTDVYLTLYSDRLDVARDTKPDLFLSIHLNSMGEAYDGNQIAGAASFYGTQTGSLFANQLYADYTGTLKVGKKGCRAENYVVVNGFVCPHVLLETGFVNNPTEAQWLFSSSGQQMIADTIAASVLKYFS